MTAPEHPSVFAIRIRVSGEHSFWKAGQFLWVQGPVEGDYGPGNWERFTRAAATHAATFYGSVAEAQADIDRLWMHTGGALEIVRFDAIVATAVSVRRRQ